MLDKNDLIIRLVESESESVSFSMLDIFNGAIFLAFSMLDFFNGAITFTFYRLYPPQFCKLLTSKLSLVV